MQRQRTRSHAHHGALACLALVLSGCTAPAPPATPTRDSIAPTPAPAAPAPSAPESVPTPAPPSAPSPPAAQGSPVPETVTYDFRAIGQEPGWILRIAEGRQIHLAADYGEVHIYTPAPAPEVDSAAGTTLYDVRTGALRLRVVIADVPCSDVMSGEPFPKTVTVRVNGQEYRGCGRPLESG